MRDILSVNDFTTEEEVLSLMKLAESMRIYRQATNTNLFKVDLNFSLRGRLMGTLFMEPSTRTRLSFESAMKRLGGDVIQIDNPKSSSIEKGESFTDTLKTIGQYVDVLVIRSNRKISDHPRSYVDCPVINAGDGAGEHPTQALTDLYTLWRHFPKLEGYMAITGDLQYGRAARSVIRMLNKFTNFTIFVYSYTPFCLHTDMTGITRGGNLYQLKSEEEFDRQLPRLDALYMTRFQQERVVEPTDLPVQKLILTLDRLNMMKPNSVIMHPLPRLDEIPRQIDHDPRAIYFEQVQNGMLVRMALLHRIFS